MRSTDFRLFLQDEFELRCQKNKQYSLRAFANFLGIGHSALSEMLRGKRKISKKAMQKFAKSLKMPNNVLKKYLEQYDRNKRLKSEPVALPDISFEQASIDDYHYMSNILHETILSCIKLKNFTRSAKCIARMTGYSLLEVEICIERLKRLKYLEITKDGQWKDIRPQGIMNYTSHPMVKKAHMKWLKDRLKYSIKRVDDTSETRPYHLTHMLPVASKDIKILEELITQFSNKLDQVAEESKGEYDQVYQYHFMLYSTLENSK